MMTTTGSPLKAGIQSGLKDGLNLMKEADKANDNINDVSVFIKMIKKAEESAQAAL